MLGTTVEALLSNPDARAALGRLGAVRMAILNAERERLQAAEILRRIEWQILAAQMDNSDLARVRAELEALRAGRFHGRRHGQ